MSILSRVITACSFIGGYFYAEPPPPYLPPEKRDNFYPSKALPAHIRPHKLSSAELEPPPPPVRIPAMRQPRKQAMPAGIRETRRAVRNLFRR